MLALATLILAAAAQTINRLLHIITAQDLVHIYAIYSQLVQDTSYGFQASQAAVPVDCYINSQAALVYICGIVAGYV